jgi:hypothetical protein
MRLRDFGLEAPREWFQQILEWSRKKITFEDNIDCLFIKANIDLNETIVGHQLGRVPRYILEISSWPNSAVGITLTKPPTSEKIFLRRASAGETTLLLM